MPILAAAAGISITWLIIVWASIAPQQYALFGVVAMFCLIAIFALSD